MVRLEQEDGTLLENGGSSVNDARTCQPAGTSVTQQRSADVLRFKIKVPKTLEQAAKLKAWLESILHTLSGKAQRHASNMIYQVKATEGLEDLLRPQKQAQMAWQAERLSRRLAEASR